MIFTDGAELSSCTGETSPCARGDAARMKIAMSAVLMRLGYATSANGPGEKNVMYLGCTLAQIGGAKMCLALSNLSSERFVHKSGSGRQGSDNGKGIAHDSKVRSDIVERRCLLAWAGGGAAIFRHNDRIPVEKCVMDG